MKKTVEDYLKLGFDLPMASYYAQGRKKIVNVQPQPDFTLILTFDNGERRALDCKSFLEKNTVFEPFMRYEDFRRVYLDDAHAVSWDIDPNVDSEIHWNNKVDLCPDSCYVDSIPLE